MRKPAKRKLPPVSWRPRAKEPIDFGSGWLTKPVAGRATYGHSLIVSPWGEVLADGGDEVGVVLAEIDPDAVDKARAAIPSLNDQAFAPPEHAAWVEPHPLSRAAGR